MVDRRGFLSSFAGAAAVGTALNFGGKLFAQLAQAPSQLPDRSLYDSNEEAYWTELRKQFLQWRSLSPQKMLTYVEESRRLFA